MNRKVDRNGPTRWLLLWTETTPPPWRSALQKIDGLNLDRPSLVRCCFFAAKSRGKWSLQGFQQICADNPWFWFGIICDHSWLSVPRRILHISYTSRSLHKKKMLQNLVEFRKKKPLSEQWRRCLGQAERGLQKQDQKGIRIPKIDPRWPIIAQ